MLKKTISILCFLFLCYSLSFAINFIGVVKDNATQQLLGGASIRVFNGNELVANAKTLADGTFNIPLAMGADYKVYIDKENYEQLRVSITTNFSAAIKELPLLELSMIKVAPKTNADVVIAKTPISVKLSGKLYHLQLGGLEGEQIEVKNNATGAKLYATTIANGNYSLDISPNANYTISVLGTDRYPEYVYAPIILNTAGINASIQIIRNFENRGIVTKETVPSKIAETAKPPVITKEKSTSGSETNKATTEIKKEKDTKPNDQILTDKDKALVENLNKKYEKLIAADTLPKKKDNMVARNVVVKFYDEDTKTEKKAAEKVVSMPVDTIKKTKEKVAAPIVKEKTAEDKKVENVKKDIPPKTTIVTKTEPVKVKKPVEEKKPEVIAVVPKPPVIKEKSAEDRRIDSMIGTGPRFMHHELTEEEKAKLNANNKSNVTVNPTLDKPKETNSPLPVGVEENRTPVIDDKIYYGEGKASLDEQAKNYLLTIANRLKANASLKIEVAVHCDLNDEASVADYICKLRIKRIVDLMVNQWGVNFQQLIIRSVGVNEPVNQCKKDIPGCTALDHQMNRRTEFKFVN